jgi:hypothetical protein
MTSLLQEQHGGTTKHQNQESSKSSQDASLA